MNKKFDERQIGDLWQMRCAGVTIEDCAAYFNISPATCKRWMAVARQRFGRRETLRGRERYSRAHLFYKMTGQRRDVSFDK